MFEDFFGSPPHVDYSKLHNNTKNLDENKQKCSRDIEYIEYRISDLNDKIKKMSEQKEIK